MTIDPVQKEKILYFLSKKFDVPLAPPRNVTLTLNYSCNQKCLMCRIKDLAFDKRCEITTGEIKGIIDEMVGMNIPDLVLTGGEPFLFEGIFDVIAYARQKSRKVVMITNGFYGDDLLRKVLASGADHLQVSLDGSSADIYDAIRGVKGAFDVVTANIRTLAGQGMSVAATATITRQNYKDLVNIARLAQELGCRRLALRPAHVSNADPLQRDFDKVPFWIPSEEIGELEKVVDDLKSFQARTGFLDFSPGVDLLVDYFKSGYLPPRGSCYIGFTRLILSYNEKGSYGVWMCRDMTGDIRKSSLRDIWRGTGARRIRRAIRKCRHFCLFPEMFEPDLGNLATLWQAIRRDAPAKRERDRKGPGPLTLQVEITNDCNLTCGICWRTLRGREVPVRNLSFDRFRKIFDKIAAEFPVREVNVQGLGEPLLCPDILPILEYIKSKGCAVWFVTNGTLLDDRMAQRLVAIGVDKIRFSIDSADPGTYAAIKKGSSLEAVVQNIQRLNHARAVSGKRHPAIALNSVISCKTWSGRNALLSLAKSLGAEDLALIPMVSFSKGLATDKEQVDFYGEEFQKDLAALKEEAAGLGIDVNPGISMESRETKFCRSGCYVDAEGRVHPCCNITRFHFGNIEKEDARLIAGRLRKFTRRVERRTLTCKACNQVLDHR